ncbi:MAG: lysophospholipid acyltransferase family protein [Candidatus Nanopelagicales bacterium]
MPDAQIIPMDGQPGRRLTASQAARAAGATGSARRRSSGDQRATTRRRTGDKDGVDATAADASGAESAADDVTAADPASGSGPDAEVHPISTGSAPEGTPSGPSEWDRRLTETLDFLRRRVTGDYEVDEYGFDPDLLDHVLMAPVRPLYDRWFRVEARGLERVPDTGGALLVANHSGTVAWDAVMTQLALLDHHPAHRTLRMLGANLVFQLPFVGELSRKGGHTLACNPDAERLLSSGELVGVWPEGYKGIGKPYRERYKLQRFGRGGFVAAALRSRVPIIPTSIVGAEEIHPIIGNVKVLARLFGLPYFPITPTFPWLGPLGMVPLPSKWIIEFGEPIPTDQLPEGSADDPMLVFNLTDQVRETIQQTLYRLLVQRRSVFF